jgi:hypothetical protein
MQLDVKWFYDSWPPTDELVIVLFDTSTLSSVSRYPILEQGHVRRLDRGIAFFPEGSINPIHSHFRPVAWRYADAFRR